MPAWKPPTDEGKRPVVVLPGHTIEPNHTHEFWLNVERAMPDYETRKAWLAEHGGRLVAL